MKRNLTKIFAVCLAIFLIFPQAVAFADTAQADTDQTISIVFSHDMHSHLEKFAKIRTIIKEKKQENESTFALDAGDFSMGTPYQTIFKSDASELRMMGYVGYDVTTLGNHEFDYRSAGLTQMLKKAIATGENLPELVIANIDWEKTLADEELAEDGEKLQEALEDYGAKSYTVLERGGMKIAVFGIFGKESASYAPESGTYFLDPVEAAKDVVEEIHAHEKVDLIVCVSHSGTNQDDPESSEDEILAAEVDGIDLIISGHSHTELQEPIVVGDTIIASVGQYNDNLGTITFTYKDDKLQMDSYELIALDNSVAEDKGTNGRVQRFKNRVSKEYFADFGYSWDTVLSKNEIAFTGIDSFGLTQGEDTLGNLIADSYIYGVKEAEGKDYETVDVAIAPAGVIRGSFDTGNITAADAFNALSLGTGKDGSPGYPLVSVYLSGEELKLVAEIDASISNIMQPARLYLSGLNYTYNPKRLILDRAYDITLSTADGDTEIQDDKLYRVVGDLYSAQMLGTVNSLSYGLLSITPKDKDGNKVTDFEDCIIYNKDGSELKEWYALASYIDDFDHNQVPSKYAKTEGRKQLVDSANPINILKSPNKFFWMIIAAVALILAVIALIIVLAVKLFRRLRYGKGTIRKKDMMFSRR